MNDVQNYINQRRAEGYTEAQIADNLRVAGWPDAEIARLLSPRPMQRQRKSFLGRNNTLFTILAVIVLVVGLVIILAFRENQSNEETANQTTTNNSSEESTETEEATDLQQARRDTNRQNDLARVAALMEISAANNNGRYPASIEELGVALESYRDEPLVDPASEEPYVLIDESPAVGEIQLQNGSTCDAFDSAGTRSYALRTQLEVGEVYCVDNR